MIAKKGHRRDKKQKQKNQKHKDKQKHKHKKQTNDNHIIIPFSGGYARKAALYTMEDNPGRTTRARTTYAIHS